MMKYCIVILVIFIISCQTVKEKNKDQDKFQSYLYSQNMVQINGNSFWMGCDSGGDDEVPIHEVELSPFMISKYEVTQNIYKKITSENPSFNKANDNNPVEQVTWNDAVIFCNLLSKYEKLDPVYIIENGNVSADFTKNGYRLPTEAEWEYCARIDTSAIDNSSESYYSTLGWINLNSGSKTHPVGTRKANMVGLYDLVGNVSEWCWDEYKKYSGIKQKNPNSDRYSTLTVYRGSNYLSFPLFLHPSRRFEKQSYFNSKFLGFRIARSIANN